MEGRWREGGESEGWGEVRDWGGRERERGR